MPETSILPELTDEASVDAWFEDESAVAEAITHVGRVRGREYRRFARGSMLVLGDHEEVVKLFPRNCIRFHATEWAALNTLDRALPVPTPEPREFFQLDGWHGIAMSRLAGQELAELWPKLAPAAKQDLGRQLGEALAVLHRLEAPAGIPRMDWPAWVATRRKTIVEMQRSRGCPEPWLDQVPGFLEESDLRPGPVGWLHTEVMREHLLVREVDGHWRLSGLFDLEPSWVGPVDYELVAAGLFVAGGDSRVFRSILEGLGRAVTPGLSARCLALTLMHRYCHLPWYAQRIPVPADAPLSDCAGAWFGV